MLTLARVPCPDAEYRDPDGGYKHYRRVQFCTGTRAVFRWVDRDAVNPLLVERLKTFNAETTAVVTDGGEPREVPDSTEYVELLSSRLSSRLPVTRNRDNRRGGQYQGMDPEDIAALGALGVLAEADGAVTARTVRERLRHNFGRFWADGYGALLPALSRLAETDPPAVSVAPEGAAATYAITDRGRESLRNLLSEPIPDPTDPDACPQFVLKVGVLHYLPPSARADELATLEDQFRRARDRYLDLETRHADALEERRGYRRDLFSLHAMLFDDHCQWLRDRRQELEVLESVAADPE